MREPICPACMNSVPVNVLADEIWCIRDTINYVTRLCEHHKDRNLLKETHQAIVNTKEAYLQLLKSQ